MNLPNFSTPPNAIAIDLDGTLLNSKAQLSKHNRTAVEKCISHGLPIIIATSRVERSIRRLIGDDLSDRCSLVMMNGAIAKGTSPLSGFVRETIPSSTVRDIVELILNMEPTVRVTIELEGFEFGCNTKLKSDTLWEINSATPEMVLSLEEAIARIPTKISVNGLGRNLSAVAHEISRHFSDSVSVIPSDNMKFLNIPSVKASKPNALRYLLDSRQISLASVIAFGDDIPDVVMLETCGISIAVANAVPEVLAITQYCTASNNDDGVAVVLERVLKTLE